MRQEISNPSDYATIDCSDRLAACLAVVLLSRGQYGIVEEGENNGMPIFIFGGCDEWFQEQFDMDLSTALSETANNRIADALESIQLGGERTSINDFTSRAHSIAKQLRDTAA